MDRCRRGHLFIFITLRDLYFDISYTVSLTKTVLLTNGRFIDEALFCFNFHSTYFFRNQLYNIQSILPLVPC